MTTKHEKIIKSHYAKLVSLSADRVMDYLVSKEIIDFEDLEDVNSKETSTQKARALLMLLVKRQDRGFYFLIEALRESGNVDLARILERAGRLRRDKCRNK